MGAAKKLDEHEKKPKVVDHDSHDDGFHLPPKKGEEGEGPWLVSYADLMTLLMGFFALIASFSKPDAKEFDKVASAASEYFGVQHEAPYEKLSQSIRQFVTENKLDKEVQIETNVEGVTMTFSGTMFFDSGDFKVKEQAADLMLKLSATIKKQETEYNAIVEGHTDGVPITHDIIASNWELSGIRAARIAKLFEQSGFKKQQLTILGWGETKPLVPNENPDGSPSITNRATNRRVVIRVFRDLPK